MVAQGGKNPAVIELVAGSYSGKGSEGIYHLTYRPDNGELSPPEVLAATDNPSYLAMDADILYAVNELDEGRVSAFHWQDDVQLVSSVATRGAAPCYLALSPDGGYLATANYMGGNISVFRRSPTGVLTDGPQVREHKGTPGTHAERQEAPHAHWVQWSPDGQRIYSVDLGIDEVFMAGFDAASGQVSEQRSALKLQPGDGPRHLYFHPELAVAYVLNELSNTVVVASQSPEGRLTETQRLSTLPAGFAQHSQAAHLEVSRDGRYLYASNRGHDSIAAFAIDATGNLEFLGTQPSGGKWPRHFLLLEEARVMVVANQHSNRLNVLPILEDGTLGAAQASVTLPQATYVGRKFPAP